MQEEHRDQLALIINRTSVVENMAGQVIFNYCARPEGDNAFFFTQVMLDSSILPLGAKVRVCLAIAHRLDFKLDGQSLHRVLEYRNAFAHHRLDSNPVFVVRRPPEEDEAHYRVNILRGNGRLDQVRRQDALHEFNTAYEKAKGSLGGLLSAIAEKLSET